MRPERTSSLPRTLAASCSYRRESACTASASASCTSSNSSTSPTSPPVRRGDEYFFSASEGISVPMALTWVDTSTKQDSYEPLYSYSCSLIRVHRHDERYPH